MNVFRFARPPESQGESGIRDRARALAFRPGGLAAVLAGDFLIWTRVDRGNSRSLATVVLALAA
ncbi:hypothetical protein [Streptomyces sp. NPDC059349]|uniref:hypothetical protein n=1 Tax=Streptomyces sp. NPDC059349 TaxID=3346808 RepID=UPI0036C73D45